MVESRSEMATCRNVSALFGFTYVNKIIIIIFIVYYYKIETNYKVNNGRKS